LEVFKKDLVGVVVESTYNWYWLVDGLMMNGYKTHLANPAAIQQYEGLKYTDDKWDSFWLAHMLRLNILPEGYIYPKEERPVRDLLRKRLQLVRGKTSHILSLEGMVSRNCGLRISSNEVKKLEDRDIKELFNNPHLVMAAKSSITIMSSLTENIKLIEKEVKSQLQLRKPFQCLLTIPGIGDILALTIMLEVGDITRFAKVGNYSSYCRCVESQRLSNGKSKGKGNSKNGNKYLAWAYVEAANSAIRHCPLARKFYQRKKDKTSNVVAIKSLSNKLSRASYYIMRDMVKYDPKMLFE
jgi:transposase